MPTEPFVMFRLTTDYNPFTPANDFPAEAQFLRARFLPASRLGGEPRRLASLREL